MQQVFMYSNAKSPNTILLNMKGMEFAKKDIMELEAGKL